MVRLKLRVKVLPQEQLSPSKSRLPPPANATLQSFLHIVDDPQNMTLGELADTIKVRYEKIFKRDLDIKKLADDLHDADELDADLTVADVFIDLGKAQVDPSDQWAAVRVVQKPSQNPPQRYVSVVQDWTAPARPPIPLFPGVLGRRRRDEFEDANGGRGGAEKRRRANADDNEDGIVSSIERDEPENSPWNKTRRWSQNGEISTRPGISDTPRSYQVELLRSTGYSQAREIPGTPSVIAARSPARGLALPSDEAYDTKSESPGAPRTPEHEGENVTVTPHEASILPDLRAAAQEATPGTTHMPTLIGTSNAPEQRGTSLQARHPILPLPTSKTQSSGKLNRPFKPQHPTKSRTSARTSMSNRRRSSFNDGLNVPSGSEYGSAHDQVEVPPRKRRMIGKDDSMKNSELSGRRDFRSTLTLQSQFPDLKLPNQRNGDAASHAHPPRNDQDSVDAVPGANDDENQMDVDDQEPQVQGDAANPQDEEAVYNSESDRRMEADEALQAQVGREDQEEDEAEQKRLARNLKAREYRRKAAERKRLEAEQEKDLEESGSEYEAAIVLEKKAPEKSVSEGKDASAPKPATKARRKAKGNDGPVEEPKVASEEHAVEKQAALDPKGKAGKQKEPKPGKPRGPYKNQNKDASTKPGIVAIPDSQPPVNETLTCAPKTMEKRGRKKKANDNEDPDPVVEAAVAAIMNKQPSGSKETTGTPNLMFSGKGTSNINLDLLNNSDFIAKAMKRMARREKPAKTKKDKETQRSSVQSVDSAESVQLRKPSVALPFAGKSDLPSPQEEPSPSQNKSLFLHRSTPNGDASKLTEATDISTPATTAEASGKPTKSKKTPKERPPPVPRFSETTSPEIKHTPILPPGFDPKLSEELQHATSSQQRAIFSRMFGTSVTDNDIRSATEKARAGSSMLRSESPIMKPRRGSKSEGILKKKNSITEVEDGTNKVSVQPKKTPRLLDPPSWSFAPNEAEKVSSNDGPGNADGAAPKPAKVQAKTDEQSKASLKAISKEKKEPKRTTADSKKQSTLTDAIKRGKGKQKVDDPATPLKLTSEDDPIILSDDTASIHSQHSDSDNSEVHAGPSNRTLKFQRTKSEQKLKSKFNSFDTPETSKTPLAGPAFSNGKLSGTSFQDAQRDRFRSKPAIARDDTTATPVLVVSVTRPTDTTSTSSKKAKLPARNIPHAETIQISDSDDHRPDRTKVKSPARHTPTRGSELVPVKEDEEEEDEEQENDHEDGDGSADVAAKSKHQKPLQNSKTEPAPSVKSKQNRKSSDKSESSDQSKSSSTGSASGSVDEYESESEPSHQSAQPTTPTLISPSSQINQSLSQAAESQSKSGSETGEFEEESEGETPEAAPVKTTEVAKRPELAEKPDPDESADSEDEEEEADTPKAVPEKKFEPAKKHVPAKKPELAKTTSKPNSIFQTETDSDTGSEEESRAVAESDSELESDSESIPAPPKTTTSSSHKNPFLSRAVAKKTSSQPSSQPTFNIASSQSQYRSTLADLKKSISGTGTPTQASGKGTKPAANTVSMLDSLKDLWSEDSASEDEEESSGSGSDSGSTAKAPKGKGMETAVKKSVLPTPNSSSQNKTPKEGGSLMVEKSAKKLGELFSQSGRRW